MDPADLLLSSYDFRYRRRGSPSGPWNPAMPPACWWCPAGRRDPQGHPAPHGVGLAGGTEARRSAGGERHPGAAGPLRARRASGGARGTAGAGAPWSGPVAVPGAGPPNGCDPGKATWRLAKRLDHHPCRCRWKAEDPATGGLLVRFPPDVLSMAPSIETAAGDATERCPYLPISTSTMLRTRSDTRPGTRPDQGRWRRPRPGCISVMNCWPPWGSKGLRSPRVTLHVGLGTFRPLEQRTSPGWNCTASGWRWPPTLVDGCGGLPGAGGRVIAVGTTSVRSLEGVAHLHGGS